MTHAFTVATAASRVVQVPLGLPAALHDIIAVVSANGAGKAGESITVYAQAA